MFKPPPALRFDDKAAQNEVAELILAVTLGSVPFR
jgi:hypothetical protein